MKPSVRLYAAVAACATARSDCLSGRLDEKVPRPSTTGADVFAAFLKEMVRNTRRLEYRNIEQMKHLDFFREQRIRRAGVSAMIRAKNEESKIVDCLSSIYDCFDEIVFVDNGSTDSTASLVTEFKKRRDRLGKLMLFSYPVTVSRCGPENEGTDEWSIHSLAYYYNWCLAKCTRSHVCKWDADMVVVPAARAAFVEALQASVRGEPAVVDFSAQTVYRSPDGRFFAARQEINREARLFPNRLDVSFKKHRLWEILSAEGYPRRDLNLVAAYELKYVSEDEFSHWSTREFETPRKQTEFRNYTLIRNGNFDPAVFDCLGDRLPA